MHTRITPVTAILTALTAALILALAISTASANNLSITHGELGTLRFTQLKFKALGSTQAECNVTLEASFHGASMPKIERTLIGYVTRAILGTCATGTARILTESLPWHIQYGGFNEALPRPRPKLRLVGAKFIISSIFGNCLATTSEANPAIGIFEPEYERGGAGLVRRMTVEPNATIPTTCGINGTFEGVGSIFEAGGAQTGTLKLI